MDFRSEQKLNLWNPSKQRFIFLFYLFSLLLLGTIGFYHIGGKEWSLIDSLYMTVITLSTVGFGEVHALSELGRLWTLILIIFGVTGYAIMLSKFGSELIEFNRYRRQKMLNRIKNLKEHYIICGFGRMGAVIAKELNEKHLPFVIIDIKESKIEKIQELGYKYLHADATMEETLISAKADLAEGIVVTLETDQDNLFVTMSARILAPKAFILSRCSKLDTNNKLKRAGANKVVNPYVAGGHKMAELLIQPTIQDTVSITLKEKELDLVIDEFNINDLDQLDGLMIKDSKIREDYNIIIVGVKVPDSATQINPDPHTILEPNQIILVLGSKENIERFRKVQLA